MKRASAAVAASGLVFTFFSLAASLSGGVLSEIFYYAAFLLPLAALLLFPREKDAEKLYPVPRSGGILPLLLAAPTLLLVWLFAALSSLIYAAIGAEAPAIDLSLPFVEAVLLHAALPALLEELFFRFLPLTLLAKHGKRTAILWSAILFSALHFDFYKMPYAFVAGLLFAALDLLSESLLPSLALHFLNNLLSLAAAYFPAFSPWVFPLLASLTLLSLALLFVRRKTLLPAIGASFAGGEKPAFLPILLVPVLLALLIAALLFFPR